MSLGDTGGRCRTAARDALNEVVGRTVLLWPGRLQVLWPGVFTVLTIKLLVDNVQQGGQSHEVRQKEFPGELRILDPRIAALRASDCVAQDAFGAVPFADALARLLEILFVDFKPNAGKRLGDEPKPLVFRLVADLGMNAGLLQFLFEGFGLGWLVEGSNGNHVHNRTLHRFDPKSTLPQPVCARFGFVLTPRPSRPSYGCEPGPLAT